MCNFGQRIGLVHKLRQLTGSKEFLDRGRDRLGVDQVMRHQIVGFGLIQTLFDCALNTDQTRTELVLGQFTNRANTTIAEVINVINFAAAVT